MNKVKTVSRKLTPEAAPVRLARFELQSDDTVRAEYFTELAAEEFGEIGIVEGLTPAAGRRFWDALDRAFARSSTMFVSAS